MTLSACGSLLQSLLCLLNQAHLKNLEGGRTLNPPGIVFLRAIPFKGGLFAQELPFFARLNSAQCRPVQQVIVWRVPFLKLLIRVDLTAKENGRETAD